MRKNLMTVKGIGKKEGNRLYRSLNGDEEGIFYYEDKQFLFREVLEQDVELVKQAREVLSKETMVLAVEESTGKPQLMLADKLLGEETVQEILEMINTPIENGLALIVFNIASGEFICIMDVETSKGTHYKQGEIMLAFSKNKVLRKRYGQKVKSRFNEICKESGLFINGCKEKIYHGTEEILIPIS